MFGRWITLHDLKKRVFVMCTPNTPEQELYEKAIRLLNDGKYNLIENQLKLYYSGSETEYLLYNLRN